MANPKLTDRLSWEKITEKIMDESNNHKSDFKKWLMSKENLGGYFFNSLLYAKAYNIQKSINNNDIDHLIVCTASEGFGKSTLAIQLGCMISPDFSLKNILFKPEDLVEGIRNAKKGDTFVLDEGNLFLLSREAMSGGNKVMLKLFALMRQRNLCLIICVPNFFTLDTYVRDHRVDTLIHIKKRGTFVSYHKKCIPIISKIGSRFKNINGVKVPHGTFFKGYFNKFLPQQNDISDESYKKFKGENFEEFLDDLKTFYESKDKKKKSELISITEAREILRIDKRSYLKLIESKEINGKKILGRWYVERAQVMNLCNNA